MADCGEFSHQAIDYQGLFDLKDAQIIRAEIDVIDVANNEAAVTLLDACDFDDWLDTDAVPFFYHCEFSSGTVEDLAKGHKAFVVGDMVYIILLPGRGEAFPPQAYIVGHVDIRGTKECLPREYVYIRFTFEIDSVESTVVTIFDVTAGATLDLASFEPIDESSPPAPASFPCVYNTAFFDWMSYNFNGATAQVLVPCTIALSLSTIPPAPGSNGLLTTDEFTNYTGNFTGLCSSISVGNGYRRDFEEYDGIDVNANYESYVYQKRQLDFSGVEILPVGGTNCITYASAATTAAKNIAFGGDGFWHFDISGVIGYPFAAFRIPIHVRWESESASIFSCNGETATINVVYSFENTYSLDFSEVGGSKIDNVFGVSCTAQFFIDPAPGTGEDLIDIVPTSGTCDRQNWDVPIDSAYISPFDIWTSTENESRCIKSGEVGVYTFLGAGALQQFIVTGGVNPLVITIDNNSSPWGGFTGSTIGPNVLTPAIEDRLAFYPFCTVTLLEGNFTITPPDVNIQIRDVLEKADVVKSNGLNATIANVAKFVMETYIAPLPTLVERNDATLEAFYGLQDGPTVNILKKKPLP